MSTEYRSDIVAIVEDNASMLRSIQRLLFIEGFAVEAYQSAEAFLDRSSDEPIGCLILDIQLPKMSGLELWQQLSSTRSDPPVIIITAVEDTSMQQAAVALGCVAYLRKPFQPEDLVAAVRGTIGKAPSRDRL